MLRTIIATLFLSVFHSEVLLAQAVDYGAVHAWQTYGDPDSASVAVAFACMVALCCVSIAYLGRLLQVDISEGKRLGERFARRFSFHALDLGGFSLGTLAIVSVTLLLGCFFLAREELVQEDRELTSRYQTYAGIFETATQGDLFQSARMRRWNRRGETQAWDSF